MIKFLVMLAKKNIRPLSLTSTAMLSITIGIWNFDLTKLLPTGTLEPQKQWELRILLTLILLLLFLSSLLFIILRSSKKEIDEISKIYATIKRDFIHYNDLLWLHDDPVPFCLHCFEADKKTFHMFVKIEDNPPRHKCQHCGYYPKASKHPDDPVIPIKTTQQVNPADRQ